MASIYFLSKAHYYKFQMVILHQLLLYIYFQYLKQIITRFKMVLGFIKCWHIFFLRLNQTIISFKWSYQVHQMLQFITYTDYIIHFQNSGKSKTMYYDSTNIKSCISNIKWQNILSKMKLFCKWMQNNHIFLHKN